MNKTVKKVLISLASVLVVIGLVAFAPISRLVYSIYDANRTNQIMKQLEEEKNNTPDTPDNPQGSDFRKQAYVMRSQDAGGAVIDLLVLTSEKTYELSHYEQVVTESSSYTSRYFHMVGAYTRSGNEVTVEPGLGALSVNPDNAGFTYYNAQYLTAEEAGGDKTRDEIFDMQYSSRTIALMSDGSFVVGGTSDASEELDAPAGRNVYSDKLVQGRTTYKTLVIFDDGSYILYSHANNSNNAEQTTGSFFGFSTYEIKDTDRGIAPDETKPEETYDIVTGVAGRGFMYANNNGSHMHFDLQADGQFLQWLATNFNATTPVFYVTESGFTIKIGAMKATVGRWGLYVPAAEVDGPKDDPETSDIKLEVETSDSENPFILHLNADGTASTGWTKYAQTVVDGTWSVFGDSVVIDVSYPSFSEKNEDGSISITVDYGQMGSKTYTMTAEQAETAAQNAKPIQLEVETSAEGKPFILAFNANNTLTTGWTNYAQTVKDGAWSITNGVLALDLEEAGYSAEVTANEDGTATITVDYGQMGGKTYTLTATQMNALKAVPNGVQLEVETSVEGKPFILNFNLDGTVVTGWTNYAQTIKEGAWSVNGGELVVSVDGYAFAISEQEDGTVAVTADYGQMGVKTYTMTAKQYASLVGSGSGDVALEVETSVEGKPFILNLNADGTVVTGWTNYAQTIKEGSWKVSGGKLEITVEGYAFEITQQEDGTVTITADYGQMGIKTYTMTAKQYATVLANAAAGDIALEVETSIEGKPFVLNLNADGTVVTGWTNYAQTIKEGSWSAFGDQLMIAVDGYNFSCEKQEDGSLAITADYGQMGTKVYTMTAQQLNAAKTNAKPIELEVGTSVEGKPFILHLRADGTLTTGWTNYAQTVVDGSWKCVAGKLTFKAGTYVFDVVTKEDGSHVISVNYDQMGSKEYAISESQLSALMAQGAVELKLELKSSVENKPFILELNADGSVTTGWTNYAQTIKEGTWDLVDGNLVITVEGYAFNVTAKEDGSAEITADYGQMGSKVYAVSAQQFAGFIG